MSKPKWRARVGTIASSPARLKAKPRFLEGLPYCDSGCAFCCAGGRCALAHVALNICEPVVSAMAQLLDESEGK